MAKAAIVHIRKKPDEVFPSVLFCVLRKLSFVTSENILLGLHHTEGAFTGVPLRGQLSRLGFRTVSLSGCAKLSGEFVIKGPVHKGFCRFNLRCLLVLEKSHSSIACPVSQISGSVTEDIPHYCGRPETPFSLHHPYRLCNEGLYFL